MVKKSIACAALIMTLTIWGMEENTSAREFLSLWEPTSSSPLRETTDCRLYESFFKDGNDENEPEYLLEQLGKSIFAHSSENMPLPQTLEETTRPQKIEPSDLSSILPEITTLNNMTFKPLYDEDDRIKINYDHCNRNSLRTKLFDAIDQIIESRIKRSEISEFTPLTIGQFVRIPIEKTTFDDFSKPAQQKIVDTCLMLLEMRYTDRVIAPIDVNRKDWLTLYNLQFPTGSIFQNTTNTMKEALQQRMKKAYISKNQTQKKRKRPVEPDSKTTIQELSNVPRSLEISIPENMNKQEEQGTIPLPELSVINDLEFIHSNDGLITVRYQGKEGNSNNKGQLSKIGYIPKVASRRINMELLTFPQFLFIPKVAVIFNQFSEEMQRKIMKACCSLIEYRDNKKITPPAIGDKNWRQKYDILHRENRSDIRQEMVRKLEARKVGHKKDTEN